MKEITIEELFNVKGGKRLPKGNLLQSIPNNHPYIRITDIKLNRILELDENFLYVPTNIQGIIKNYVVNEGDIVISIVGQIGLITRIGKSLNLANLTENCVKLIPKQRNIIDLNYILYYLKSNLGQDQILERVVGSTQPKLPIYNINSIVIKLPHIQKQQAIAGVLSALDDKIDLLQRQNQTLELMAATLFRQWFIEEAQEDWEKVELAQHILVQKGLSYKGNGLTDSQNGIPLFNLNSVLEGGGFKDIGMKYYCGEFKDRHLIAAGDLIIANTEQGHDFKLIGYPAVIPSYFTEQSIFTHHLFKVKINIDSYLSNSFLYYLFCSSSVREQIISATNGSTVNQLSSDGLQLPKFKLPPLELVQKFTQLAQFYWDKKDNNKKQIQTLQSLRDTLLPKLISGEVRLKGFAEKVDGLQDAS